MPTTMRECPACAMEAPADEAECPYCGYEFPVARAGTRSMGWLFVLLMVLGLVPLLAWVLRVLG